LDDAPNFAYGRDGGGVVIEQDVKANITVIVEAIANNTPEIATGAAMGLLADTLININRIANALERIAGPQQPVPATHPSHPWK
jgi:hypothetical protein